MHLLINVMLCMFGNISTQAKEEVKLFSIFTCVSGSLAMQCAISVCVNERAFNKERISLGASSVVQRNKEGREVERWSIISLVTSLLHPREQRALEDTALTKRKLKWMCVPGCVWGRQRDRETEEMRTDWYNESKDAAGKTSEATVMSGKYTGNTVKNQHTTNLSEGEKEGGLGHEWAWVHRCRTTMSYEHQLTEIDGLTRHLPPTLLPCHLSCYWTTMHSVTEVQEERVYSMQLTFCTIPWIMICFHTDRQCKK